jgi:bifunctional UDP-N-acetylglucosamine pyrophosphorylase / glucosamine-1-phosphate N-acetyltransferase
VIAHQARHPPLSPRTPRLYHSFVSAPTVLILAAGEGTRMRSETPKMLHPVCGRPMVAWPIHAARDAGAERIAVIVSPDRDISAAIPDGVQTVVQPEPDGTGGAVRAALDVIRDSETVVVLSGDHPLVTGELISNLVEVHREARAAGTVLTTEREDPDPFGRILRDANGEVERIVETKHPEGVPPEVLAIREVNTNTFVFAATPLADSLGQITNDNPAGEFYVGDVLPVLRQGGLHVIAHKVDDPIVNLGVNTRVELARVTAEARRRILEGHMLAGVTVTDPDATWIEAPVGIEPDTTIEPGCFLRGATRIGRGTMVGPYTTLVDTRVGEGCSIVRSHLQDCEVGARCTIGPFSYIRPGTVLGERVKVGASVEIKNSRIAAGTKVPHLSYIGDADIGEGANIGAGTITANYDGFRKHRTRIGDRARLSVDTMLVAPVDVGDDAYTGAGAVIREDVPPGALGVTRGEQRNIEGYAEKRAKEAKQEDAQEEGAEPT